MTENKKYTWEGWDSSGEEDWVFAVEHPQELMGTHARLIDSAVKETEKVEACIYAPRVPSTSTPFGLKSEESSCGLCLTDKRFIVTKDRHIKGMEPELFSVGFEDIVYFNFGKAMLLSWFSIKYLSEGYSKQLTVIFSANGRHHFEKALRSYKKYCRAVDAEVLNFISFSPASLLYKITDTFHRGCFKNIFSLNEKGILAFVCYCSGDKATFLLTTKSLMMARSSRESAIGTATDILIIPLEKIKNVSLAEIPDNNAIGYDFRIEFKKQENVLSLSLSVIEGKSIIGLENLESLLGKIKKEGEDGWI